MDGGRNMNILIGPENVNEALKDTSVVMASYDIGDNMRGVIGVVGPTRMDYAKVTARLSYFADSLTRMFGKGELPSGRRGRGRAGAGIGGKDSPWSQKEKNKTPPELDDQLEEAAAEGSG